jgi:hypothetical protein
LFQEQGQERVQRIFPVFTNRLVDEETSLPFQLIDVSIDAYPGRRAPLMSRHGPGMHWCLLIFKLKMVTREKTACGF